MGYIYRDWMGQEILEEELLLACLPTLRVDVGGRVRFHGGDR